MDAPVTADKRVENGEVACDSDDDDDSGSDANVVGASAAFSSLGCGRP